MKHIELLGEARRLHRQGLHQSAFDLLASQLDQVKYGHLLFENHPIWWAEIRAGICTLSRRSSKDVQFVRRMWGDEELIYRFHRHANSLPAESEKLAALLDREHEALVNESHALHWVVKDRRDVPWGLLSLTGISLTQKRAEVILGVVNGAPMGLSTAAMLVLFQFYFRVIKFNKLVSLIYEDNSESLRGTLHLGFKEEGRLRNHVIDPRSNEYVNLIQTGLLAEDAFSDRNKRLMKKLLKEP